MHLIRALVLLISLSRASPLSEMGAVAPVSAVIGESGAINNTAPVQDLRLVRGVTTSLAVLAIVLTAAAYGIMMAYASPLAHGILLPTRSLQSSISKVLERHWPPSFHKEDVLDFRLSLLHRIIDEREHLFAPILPFQHSFDIDEKFRAEGYKDIRPHNWFELGDTITLTRMIWVDARSSAMKSLVQTAIWEVVAVWLVLMAVFNTAVYNGFIEANPGPDGILRLALVTAYAVATICHLIYATRLFLKTLQSLAFLATWTVVSRLFVFLNGSEMLDPGQHPVILRRLKCDLLGETQLAEAWECYEREADGTLLVRHQKPHESEIGKTLKPIIDTEVKNLEKSAESGLERMLANVFIILGINFAAGLAPWTSARSTDPTAAQLGSYALLLALGSGAAAMLSSITYISNAAVSAEVLMRAQEHMIIMEYRQHARPDSWFLFDPSQQANVTGAVPRGDLMVGLHPKKALQMSHFRSSFNYPVDCAIGVPIRSWFTAAEFAGSS